MGCYRKRPTEVNAIRVQEILDAQGSHPQALPERIAGGEDVGLPVWVLSALVPDPETDEGYGALCRVRTMVGGIVVRTIQGQDVEAGADEWLLQGEQPIDLWPVTADVFESSYEAI